VGNAVPVSKIRDTFEEAAKEETAIEAVELREAANDEAGDFFSSLDHKL